MYALARVPVSNQVVIGPGTPPPASSDCRTLSASVRRSIQDFDEADARLMADSGRADV